MAKGFNEKEKEILRKKLIEKGRELFGLYGLKKTSIEELTKAVGIAQGSFYIFFDSKEELYFEILELEEQSIKNMLINNAFANSNVTRENFKNFLLLGLEIAQTNPFMQRIYQEDNYDLLLRKLPLEKIEQHLKKDTDILLPLITRWQKDGIMVDKQPQIISSVIRSLFLLTLHKKEIGEANYHETLEMMIDLISEGLIKK